MAYLHPSEYEQDQDWRNQTPWNKNKFVQLETGVNEKEPCSHKCLNDDRRGPRASQQLRLRIFIALICQDSLN